ncbi:MAG: hypothetical protein M1821_006385 [Bathelium mastoideum]|nr:MAG: hypothetical protein M1821_006385 [Bathelium mastoideum]
MSELRRRMRAFIPAQDLKHLREDIIRHRASANEDVDAEKDSDASYRRESWMHHEVPPYNNNDWFFFSSGTASTDPWDFKHHQQHRERAGTHVWWHSPDLKLEEMHNKGQECLLRAYDVPEQATTTSREGQAGTAHHRHGHHRPKEGEHFAGEKPEQEYLFSSRLRPDPTMFGSVNISPGKTDSALALIGYISAAAVCKTAMQKVPVEVPLDESKLNWVYTRLQETISGQASP